MEWEEEEEEEEDSDNDGECFTKFINVSLLSPHGFAGHFGVADWLDGWWPDQLQDWSAFGGVGLDDANKSSSCSLVVQMIVEIFKQGLNCEQ